MYWRRKYQEVSQTFFFRPDPPFTEHIAHTHAREIASRKKALRARAHQTAGDHEKKLVRFLSVYVDKGYFKQWTAQNDLKTAGKLTKRHYIDASIFCADKRRKDIQRLTISVFDREMYFYPPVMARKRFYLTKFIKCINQNERKKTMIENLNNGKDYSTMENQNFLDGELLTMAEAAAKLKITRKALYDWKRKGKIRTVKVAGSLVRIPAADLAALITR